MAGRASVAYSLKYGTGDLIAQQLSGDTSGSVDRTRASYFFVFGGYYGVVNYSVFWLLSRSPFPTTPWAKAVFSAFFDGGVHVPLSFYPQFYVLGNGDLDPAPLCSCPIACVYDLRSHL